MKAHLFNRIDFLIVPIVVIIIWRISLLFKKRLPKEIQKYFSLALWLRYIGTLGITAITEFYYQYGDTYHYYYNAQMLRDYFFKDSIGWFNLLFSKTDAKSDNAFNYLSMINNYDVYSAAIFKNIENATVCKIASVFNLICFNSYLGIAIIFGFISFLGCLYIFKTFTHIFPGYEKLFAWTCLFLPSLWFWGSGVLKDPLCIYALGLMTYNVFVKHNNILKRVMLILFGAFLLIYIKPYIFYAFCLALLFAIIYFTFKKSSLIIKIFSLFLILFFLFIFNESLTNLISASVESIMVDTNKALEIYQAQAEKDGGSIIIPTIDPTPIGFLKLSIEGLVSVYMKPFPWEINKIVYLFVILENCLIFYLIFYKQKITNTLFKKNSLFFLNFSVFFFLILGIIIGVTTFNLGTISRYRVPALPFLFAGIVALKLVKKKRETT